VAEALFSRFSELQSRSISALFSRFYCPVGRGSQAREKRRFFADCRVLIAKFSKIRGLYGPKPSHYIVFCSLSSRDYVGERRSPPGFFAKYEDFPGLQEVEKDFSP
jgi:hypothetical protein